MIVNLLTEHHLEFLSLKGGCRGSSKSTLVKMSNCWNSHAAAHIKYFKTSPADQYYNSDGTPQLALISVVLFLQLRCSLSFKHQLSFGV